MPKNIGVLEQTNKEEGGQGIGGLYAHATVVYWQAQERKGELVSATK